MIDNQPSLPDTRPAPVVLVIDDDPVLREFIRIVLSDRGYRIHEAADGDEGLREYRACKPDLVLTDIVMPNTEGLELIMGLREADPDTPIIAMSGGNLGMGPDYLSMAQKLGADATLQKPIAAADLLSTVAAFLAASGNPCG